MTSQHDDQCEYIFIIILGPQGHYLLFFILLQVIIIFWIYYYIDVSCKYSYCYFFKLPYSYLTHIEEHIYTLSCTLIYMKRARFYTATLITIHMATNSIMNTYAGLGVIYATKYQATGMLSACLLFVISIDLLFSKTIIN